MPLVTKAKDETRNMATNAAAGGQDAPREDRPLERGAKPAGRGFFNIYKRGQGYWTRMGTVAAAILIGLLTANFIHCNMKVWLPEQWAPGAKNRVVLSAVLAFLAGYSLLCFWLV